MGRTVRVSRPSMRGSPSRIWLRTILASISNSRSLTLPASNASPPSFSAVYQIRSKQARTQALREANASVMTALKDGVGFAQGLRAGLLAADLIDRAQLFF